MLTKLLASIVLLLPTFGDGLLYAESAKHLFEQVLVIGASVSADAYAPSPGKLVSKQAQVLPSRLVVRAKDGAKSDYHEKWLNQNIDRIKPSIVFGLDLFIHDVKKSFWLSESVKQRARRMIATMCRSAQSVYIGNTIPFGFYMAPFQFNSYLNELKKEFPNLHIVAIDQIYVGLYGGGYNYNVDGVQRKVTKKQALKDDLHPNLYGSTLMANVLIQQIRRDNYEIDGKDLPYLPVK